jgi:hypothetical protein
MSDRRLHPDRLHADRLLPLAIGLGVLLAGTAAGWDAGLVQALAAPPALIRAALVGAAVVSGIALLGRAVTRLSAADPAGARERDLVSLTRGVRLAFLAVAAFSAAAGWAIGHPLPIVIALVIAGVDVLETSFLLLMIATRRATDATDDQTPVAGA